MRWNVNKEGADGNSGIVNFKVNVFLIESMKLSDYCIIYCYRLVDELLNFHFI